MEASDKTDSHTRNVPHNVTELQSEHDGSVVKQNRGFAMKLQSHMLTQRVVPTARALFTEYSSAPCYLLMHAIL